MTNHPAERDQPSDPPDDVRHMTTFDPESDAVSEELVLAIATINDALPAELEVLANTVDPDALNALFQPRADGTLQKGDPHVRLRYADHIVDVQSDGTITFLPDPGED